MCSGSEALTAALVYYNSVKQADKCGVNKARGIYTDLQQRFPGRPRRAADRPKPSE